MNTEITVEKERIHFFEEAVDSLVGLSILSKEWKDDGIVVTIDYYMPNSLIRLGQMFELKIQTFEAREELKKIEDAKRAEFNL